jgi:hypothetical protein
MFIVWPMPKGYGAMLPRQLIMVKANRADTRAHVFAASCAAVAVSALLA